MRGRPPVTRDRVLAYIEAHPGCPVMRIARSLGIDRAQVYRILHALYGPDWRERNGRTA